MQTSSSFTSVHQESRQQKGTPKYQVYTKTLAAKRHGNGIASTPKVRQESDETTKSRGNKAKRVKKQDLLDNAVSIAQTCFIAKPHNDWLEFLRLSILVQWQKEHLASATGGTVECLDYKTDCQTIREL